MPIGTGALAASGAIGAGIGSLGAVTATGAAQSIWPSIAANAVSSGGTGLFGWIGARRQNQHQIQLARQAEAHNIKMWQKQADYNSPQAQMQRLAAAGLNPNLIYGEGAKGASGMQQTAPQAVMPQVQNEMATMQIPYLLDIVEKMQNIKNKAAEEDAIKANTHKNLASGYKFQEETNLKGLETQLAMKIFEDQKRFYQARADKEQNQSAKEYWLGKIAEIDKGVAEDWDHPALQALQMVLRQLGLGMNFSRRIQ